VQGNPAIVHGTAHPVIAFWKSDNAFGVVLKPIHSVDNVDETDIFGLEPQAKPTARAFLTLQQAFAGKLLEEFGKKVSGNFLVSGDILRHGALSVFEASQVEGCTNCIFGGTGVNHAGHRRSRM